MFIDTHTHLYLEEFDNDLEAVIRRSLDSNVTKLLLPNIDLHSWGPMLGLCDAFPGICLPMAGVHPTSVTRDSIEDELNKVIEQLKTGRYIAVGEIGIDLYWDKTFQAEQEQVFAKQLQLAKDFKLPVAIHMRNSFEEVWNVLKNEISPELKGVFHCFSGNLEQARQVIDAGFMLGIGGVVTFKNSGLQDVIKEVGLEHLILETDAPYLAPVPYRGQRNEPSYIPIIASKIAEITATPLVEVEAITTRNARLLFGI